MYVQLTLPRSEIAWTLSIVWINHRNRINKRYSFLLPMSFVHSFSKNATTRHVLTQSVFPLSFDLKSISFAHREKGEHSENVLLWFLFSNWSRINRQQQVVFQFQTLHTAFLFLSRLSPLLVRPLLFHFNQCLQLTQLNNVARVSRFLSQICKACYITVQL